MNDKVISLANKTGNGTMQSPQQALEEAMRCIGKEGAFEEGKKVLIIALDDTTGSYRTNWIQAGMKMSECLTLCEVAKVTFLEEMNYINSTVYLEED